MANNRGKQFEAKLKEDIKRTLPDCSIDRIYDSVSGYKAISNISDFIMYNYPNIYYLEAKSHEGASFPLANLTQYDKLIYKVGIKGVRAGMVLWLIDKNRVLYVPISTIKKLKENDYKSFNPEKINKEEYFYLDIPSEKKRVFLESDYSCLIDLKEGQ